MIDLALTTMVKSGDCDGVTRHFQELKSGASVPEEVVRHELQLALIWAASAGQVEMIDCSIHLGAHADAPEPLRGHLALVLAAKEGYLQVVRLLVQYGADPSKKDKWGRTPRRAAEIYRHPEVVQWLDSLQ